MKKSSYRNEIFSILCPTENLSVRFEFAGESAREVRLDPNFEKHVRAVNLLTGSTFSRSEGVRVVNNVSGFRKHCEICQFKFNSERT